MVDQRLPRLRPQVLSGVIRRDAGRFALLHPTAGDYLEFGPEEYFLLVCLDQQRPFHQLATDFESRFGKALTVKDVGEFVNHLRHLDLLESDIPDQSVAFSSRVVPAARPASLLPGGWLNFGFDIVTLLFGWILNPLLMVPTALLGLLSIAVLVRRWDHYVHTLAQLKSQSLLVLLALLLAIEMAVFTLPSAVLTGMACRKAGGHIRKLGIKLWQDVIPIVYCDIGDSFEQMKNADRWVLLTIHVWWLLSVLLVSTVSWSTSVLGGTPQKLWVFLFFPCLVQLLLHLILFAKGDGYLMLCHAVGDARFHERAVNEAACWLGVGGSPEPLTSAERYWMRVYGVGNYLFRIFAEVAVFGLGGYWLMHNYGPSGAIFVLSAALWFHRDWLFAALGAVGAIAWLIRGGGNRPTQWAVRLILLAGLIAVGLLPYKHEIAGQCRIIAPEQRAVRTQIEDELVEVFVHEGDQVSPGDRIATLSGRKAHADVRIARAELEKAQATLALLEAGRRAEDLEKAEADLRYQEQRLLSQQEELARNEKLHKTNAIPAKQLDESRSRRDELQARVDSAKAKLTKMKEGFREERIAAERANVARFAEKLAYAEQQEKLLNILSPIRGQIVSPYMQQKLGQYVKPGDTIAIIQDLDTLMVEVAAADSAVAEVQPGMEVRIRLPAWNEGDLVMGQVTKVALAPQPERVSHVDAVDTQEEAFMDQSLNEQYSASTYRVRVYAELIDAPAELRPEMTGYARIVVGDDQLWRACVRPIATFLKTEVWSWLP